MSAREVTVKILFDVQPFIEALRRAADALEAAFSAPEEPPVAIVTPAAPQWVDFPTRSQLVTGGATLAVVFMAPKATWSWVIEGQSGGGCLSREEAKRHAFERLATLLATNIAPGTPEAKEEAPRGHGEDRSDPYLADSAATTPSVEPVTPTARPA